MWGSISLTDIFPISARPLLRPLSLSGPSHPLHCPNLHALLTYRCRKRLELCCRDLLQTPQQGQIRRRQMVRTTCWTGLGIYKRKKESKKLENADSFKKKRNYFFLIVFLDAFLVECLFSWTSSFCLEQVLFFLDYCVFSWTSARFLTFFFFSFIYSQPCILLHLLKPHLLSFCPSTTTPRVQSCQSKSEPRNPQLWEKKKREMLLVVILFKMCSISTYIYIRILPSRNGSTQQHTALPASAVLLTACVCVYAYTFIKFYIG